MSASYSGELLFQFVRENCKINHLLQQMKPPVLENFVTTMQGGNKVLRLYPA